MHGYTEQLIGHFHGDLVVGDIDELHTRRHLFNHTGITPHVGVIQRRIYLIQHTERRRVELEDREHQRNGRQRLFTTRQQVNGAVLLARRARHDGHAGVEQVIAGQLQIGVTATKDFREQRLQAVVDLVEGLFKARTGFPVNLANNLLQGA